MLRCVLLACVMFSAGAAYAQETTQTTEPAAPAVEPAADPAACVLPTVPGRLMLTMPTEPKLPACAAKNNCNKATADSYNAAILSYNKSMDRVNEATSDYVAKLNEFTRQAGRYASCELTRINETVGVQ